VLVDSCVNPETGEPAALSYLNSIGVNPGESVCLVLVTHWDDDHIGGVARVVEACEHATVACSLALDRQDIFQFVIQQSQGQGGVGSGLDELRTILRQCRSTGRLVWAKATLPLHPRAAGGNPTVVALSPSDDAVSRSIESLIERATGEQVAFPRRYKAPEGPNGASVAAMVRAGETSMLLGADLENAPNPQTGWEAVLAHAKPDTSASVVKVAHHGSEGAHHDGVWDEIVDDDPVAIVTPWVLAGGHLPTEEDLARLRGVAENVYLTAMPTFGRARKGSAVEKLITKVAGVRLQELRGWGHVRARRRPGETSWRVELDGDARAIP
jgi:beta-lactamase superfamily II metal-dependent hydrolase